MLRTSRIRVTSALTAVALATVITSFSSPGFAAGGDGAVDALMATGIDRYKRHDYEGARAIFARAHEVSPSEVGILFNLALAEIQSGHPVDAATHLRAFMASSQAQPERRESARSKWLPEAEAQIGRVSVDAPSGTEVSIDGTSVGAAPLEQPVYVTPGDHEVRAKLATGERSMHISAPAGNIVTARFVPEEPPPPQPASGLPPPPERVAVAEVAPPPTARATQPGKLITVAAIGGTAIAAAGIALGFGQASIGAQNHAQALRSQPELSSTSSCYPPGSSSLPAGCADLSAATSDQNRYYSLQLGFYAAAGALAVGAVTTWFLWPHPAAQSSWSIQPTVDVHSASAQLVGSF
jgi:hypothetical protein